jgi:rSAM/selenodomain-associated transferase 1
VKGGRGAICVFAKVPRPGHVKTRLARTRGDRVAASLAAAFLEDTLALLREVDASVILALDDEPPECWRSACFWKCWHQGQGTLGERVERVLGRALERHPWAIALGADSPGLPRSIVEGAIDSLRLRGGPDAVLGPCPDGGFYLLGVRAPWPAGTLGTARFSTAHALEDTQRALQGAGFSTQRLDAWFDIDEEDDLVRLETLLANGAVDAPATARVLRGEP